jgi:Anti-sigma-K factor rskA, C-terminal/Anti-sigma-K factor RskA, N-terminal domain
MGERQIELHTLVGAYALDAVEDEDRPEFERHLLTCEQCRDDVRGLRETTARLAAATAITPRPELRQSTMQATAVVRQLPPVVPGDRAVLGPRRGRWLARRVIARPWLAGVAAGLTVVLAVAAVVLGLHAGAMQHRLAAQEQRDSAMTVVLGAHDAVVLTAAVSTGGTATVVMSHQARALVFTAKGLARLPGAMAYELWLAGPAGVTSAGMLPPGLRGMSGPMVVRGVAKGEQLELTAEPASGSRQPTSAPVVRVELGV